MVPESKVHPGRRQGFFQLSPHVFSLCLRVWEGGRTQREGGAVQVEPRVAVQWPITLDPAGGEDKGASTWRFSSRWVACISSIGYGTSAPIQCGGKHLRSGPCPPPPKLPGGRFGFYLHVYAASQSKASGWR